MADQRPDVFAGVDSHADTHHAAVVKRYIAREVFRALTCTNTAKTGLTQAA